jgi:hypothetical protein
VETQETAETAGAALLREARRADVPEIVALLADDAIGVGREGSADDADYAASASRPASAARSSAGG